MEQENSKPPKFNTESMNPDLPVHFVAPDGTQFELPKAWYAKSVYVSRSCTLIPESHYSVNLSIDNARDYKLLYGRGPESLPELYEYYDLFVLYDFDTSYVADCMFFQLFISQIHEDRDLLSRKWLKYLFNIANLTSSHEHQKLYRYPNLSGEYYIQRSNSDDTIGSSESNRPFNSYDAVSETEALDDPGNVLTRVSAYADFEYTPDWRKYSEFIRTQNYESVSGLGDTNKPVSGPKDTNKFINDFFGADFDINQVPSGDLTLPLIMRHITDPRVHERLMCNYRTYHFYLSDPVLFKQITKPIHVIRIYHFMMIQETIAYLSGADPGVAVIEFQTLLRLIAINKNECPNFARTQPFLFNNYYNRDNRRYRQKKIDVAALKKATPDLPGAIHLITQIPGVALTGSRMSEIFTCGYNTYTEQFGRIYCMEQYTNSDYDIMVVANTPELFELKIAEILSRSGGRIDARVEKKIGIGYGYKIHVNNNKLDVFAIPGDINFAFNQTILTFHMAPVRAYFTRGKIYMLPSAIDCLLSSEKKIITGIRYVTGGEITPLEIIKKQFQRGFRTIMFQPHQHIIAHYLRGTDFPQIK